MKLNINLLILLFTVGQILMAKSNTTALVPMPNNIKLIQGKSFKIIEGQTKIVLSSSDISFEGETLKRIIKDRTGANLLISDGRDGNIHLIVNPKIGEAEHYRIQIDKKNLKISGSTAAALFYGIMTLDQILMADICHTTERKVAPIEIDDSPRFPFRALMIDPARNFIPVDDVKFFIDQMVRYKFNKLQLHLTDDEGWRIEIKKHPQLASEKHYTQEDIKDIIEYASKRHVEVIPEIDIPGHTVAILAAYPELGCTHTDTLPKIVGKTTNMVLCPANQQVYKIFNDIITEVAQLFPSPQIHLGGDEAAIEKHWTRCTKCQSLMQERGYTKVAQLMIPFFDQMLSFVDANGKKPVLWCELNNIYPPASDYLFPYPKNTTLVTWRYGLTPTCIDLTHQNGHNLIMAPGEHTYLDYPQYRGDFPEFKNWGMPITTLEKSYMLDPGYGLPEQEQAHIQGVMATLWAEAINNIDRLTYMTYPRAIAIAEAGWTQMENRDWDSFKERLFPNIYNLMKKGVSVRVPFEISTRKKSIQ